MNRVFFIIILISLIFYMGLSSYAFAQVDAPSEFDKTGSDTVFWGQDDDSVDVVSSRPASGTIIAGALETAGYRAQEHVLKSLGEMLDTLGVLFYVGSFGLALTVIALTRQYSMGLWFLIGPTLFTFFVKNTTVGTGVEWRFGAASGGVDAFVEALDGSDSGDMTSEVAWFFQEYNVFISNTMQTLISVLSADNIKDQALFMARQRILNDIVGSEAESSGVTDLARFSIAHCSQQLDAARIIALGKRDPAYRHSPEFRDAIRYYYGDQEPATPGIQSLTVADYQRYAHALHEGTCNESTRNSGEYKEAQNALKYKSTEINKKTIEVRHQGVLNYLATLYPAVRDNQNIPLFDAKDPTTEDVPQYALNGAEMAQCLDVESLSGLASLNTSTESVLMSCEQLWCWMGAAVAIEATDRLKETTNKYAGAKEIMKDAEHDAFMKELYGDISRKLTKPAPLLIPQISTIEEIKENGEAVPHVQFEKSCARANPDPSIIPVIVGGYMIRKVMQSDVKTAMREQLMSRSGFRTSGHNYDLMRQPNESYTDEQMYQFMRDAKNYQYSQSQQYQWFTYALMLPYIQGVILFALSVLYPFFALMLIIPGRANAIVTWMLLWAWVKSWDVGFAVVMVVDGVLWQLMPHSATWDPIKDPNHGPITMLESAFEGDPAYSLTSYYMILGVMLSAVPVLTGKFLVGGAFGAAAKLLDAGKELGAKFGRQQEVWVAADQAHRDEYIRHMYNMRHALNGMGSIGEYGGNLDRPLKDLQAQVTDAQQEGDKRVAQAGAMGMVSALVSGVTGMGNALTFGIGSGVTKNTLKGLGSSGVNMKRLANATQAFIYADNLALRYSQNGNSPAFVQSTMLEASSNNRGEFWRFPQLPTGKTAGLASELINNQMEIEKYRIQGISKSLNPWLE